MFKLLKLYVRDPNGSQGILFCHIRKPALFQRSVNDSRSKVAGQCVDGISLKAYWPTYQRPEAIWFHNDPNKVSATLALAPVNARKLSKSQFQGMGTVAAMTLGFQGDIELVGQG